MDFIDISNVFPSTPHAGLWARLEAYNFTGTIFFDWLRMFYTQMTFVVSLEGESSSEFKSLCGVLAGDPLSPTLRNIFLASFTLDVDSDDVPLLGIIISLLEHADDMAVISRSPAGHSTPSQHGLCMVFIALSPLRNLAL